MEISLPLSSRSTRLFVMLTGLLFALNLIFIVLRFGFAYEDHRALFEFLYVDREGNLPSWYSASLLLLCSILLTSVAMRKQRAGDRFARKWGLLAIIFLFLSLDEGAAVHELTDHRLHLYLHTTGPLLHAWVLLALALVIGIGIAYIDFIWMLPRAVRWRVITAAVLYISGAVGFEILSTNYATQHGDLNLTYALLSLVEEGLEMLGVILFMHALLRYTEMQHPPSTL